MAQERLDKLLSSTGRWSRREVKELIRQGRVWVDGVPARRPEEKCEPGAAGLTVDGERVDCALRLSDAPQAGGPPVRHGGPAAEDSAGPAAGSTCAAGGSSRWGGWTRIRKACSYSPTTEGWPIGPLPGPPCEQGVLCGGRWTAGPGGSGGVPARPCFTGWNGMLACGTHRAGPTQPRLITLEEGKYHQVKRMLAGPGEASDLPQTPLHGSHHLGP